MRATWPHPEPADNLEAAVTSHAIKITEEGHKFGLYLLVASQRPSKIHANVLSQCDKLLLMKTSLAADIAHISQIFLQVPTTFVVQSPHLAQGECLLVGRIMKNPTFGGCEGCFSEEGVTDVPTSWATLEKGSG